MDQNQDEITKDTNIASLVEKYPELTQTFFNQGMYCVGCGGTLYETVGEGAIGHGINPDSVVKELNEDLKRLYKTNEETTTLIS